MMKLKILNINKLKKLLIVIVILSGCEDPQDKEVIQTFENGNIKVECDLVKGLKHGECVEYFEDGSQRVVSSWVNDTINDQSKIFHSNGKVYQLTTWEMGVKHGPFKSYFKNGQIRREVLFKEGKEFGVEKNFDSLGNLLKRIEWINAQNIHFANTETNFSSSGDTIFQSHFAVIEPEIDTLIADREYDFTIALKEPIYQKMEVYIGRFGDDFKVYEGLEIDTIKPSGFKFNYKLNPEELSDGRLKIIFKDYKEEISNSNRSKVTYQLYYFNKKWHIK